MMNAGLRNDVQVIRIPVHHPPGITLSKDVDVTTTGASRQFVDTIEKDIAMVQIDNAERLMKRTSRSPRSKDISEKSVRRKLFHC